MELHAKNSNLVKYIRAHVWIKADEPLKFRRLARFRTREIIPTEQEYEKLLNVCFLCKWLTHYQTACPDKIFHESSHRRNWNTQNTQPQSVRKRPKLGKGKGIMVEKDSNKDKAGGKRQVTKQTISELIKRQRSRIGKQSWAKPEFLRNPAQ